MNKNKIKHAPPFKNMNYNASNTVKAQAIDDQMYTYTHTCQAVGDCTPLTNQFFIALMAQYLYFSVVNCKEHLLNYLVDY